MKKIVALLMVISMCFISLTGCSEVKENLFGDPYDNAEPETLAIVIGRNESFPDFSMEHIRESVYDVAYNLGSVYIIVNDGAPNIDAAFSIAHPETKVDEEKRRQLLVAANILISLVVCDDIVCDFDQSVNFFNREISDVDKISYFCHLLGLHP